MPPGGRTSPSPPLNLCDETLDGIRNHSWSRPAPATPEGEVVSWADRIAYVCHDFEDAVPTRHRDAGRAAPTGAGTLRRPAQPAAGDIHRRHGRRRPARPGGSAWATTEAEALAAFRASNYEHIYLRPSSVEQGRSVMAVLRALVDYYSDRPHLDPGRRDGRCQA